MLSRLHYWDGYDEGEIDLEQGARSDRLRRRLRANMPTLALLRGGLTLRAMKSNRRE